MPIFSAIDFMASTVSLDRLAALLPRRVRPRGHLLLWRLFSAFCVMEALISSSEEVVSSTEAACSPVPCDSVWEEAAT